MCALRGMIGESAGDGAAAGDPHTPALVDAQSPARDDRSWYASEAGSRSSYMANTESSRAKARSQSAPRQRLSLSASMAEWRAKQGVARSARPARRPRTGAAQGASLPSSECGSSASFCSHQKAILQGSPPITVARGAQDPRSSQGWLSGCSCSPAVSRAVPASQAALTVSDVGSSAKQVANLPKQAGRAAAVSVKVSPGREAASSKMGNAAGADSPWQEVWWKVWRKRQAEHRRELHARRPTHEHHRRMPEAVEWLHKRFAGRCFRCLASDHRITKCRDPVKCALCLRSGHRARQCRSPKHSSATVTSRPQQPPPTTFTQHLSAAAMTASAMDPHRVLLDHARPGLPSHHPDRIEGCVEFTAEMVAIENDYHSHAVIAIKICDDPWFHLTHDAVCEAIGIWLDVSCRDVEVEFYPTKGFIVLLPSVGVRDSVLSAPNDLTVG
jgi:hypothetical protein